MGNFVSFHEGVLLLFLFLVERGGNCSVMTFTKKNLLDMQTDFNAF